MTDTTARYGAACDAAAARFQPLTDALAAHGLTTTIDQTGGMVFCLRVVMPEGRWAWFLRDG